MDETADRNKAQREGIANLALRLGTAHHRGTYLQALGGHDVAFLTIGVLQQGEPSGTDRIIFDGRHLGRYSQLVALEINETNLLLMSTADRAGGDPPVTVAPPGLLAGHDQLFLWPFLSDLGE